MTVAAKEITPLRHDPAHAEQLSGLATQADKIRYACQQVRNLTGSVTTPAVRQWLDQYDIATSRSHASTIVKEWRDEYGLASTGELTALSPELLAELDQIDTGVRPPDIPADTAPDSDITSGTSALVTGHQPEATGHALDVSGGMSGGLPNSRNGVLDDVRSEPSKPLLAVSPQGPERPDVRSQGRAVAWAAFVIGGLVSVAANVAHSLYPTATQLETWTASGRAASEWTPNVGAMLFAAFWPIALILAVEVITRVNWRPGALFGIARYAGTSLVAVVAAVMSYRHMSGLLAIWGEDAWGAHLGPLAVDGLMVVAAAALLSMSRTQQRSP